MNNDRKLECCLLKLQYGRCAVTFYSHKCRRVIIDRGGKSNRFDHYSNLLRTFENNPNITTKNTSDSFESVGRKATRKQQNVCIRVAHSFPIYRPQKCIKSATCYFLTTVQNLRQLTKCLKSKWVIRQDLWFLQIFQLLPPPRLAFKSHVQRHRYVKTFLSCYQVQCKL